jgi:transposase
MRSRDKRLPHPRVSATSQNPPDSTAIRWAKRWRETGSFEAKSNKGQSRSPLKKHEEWLLELVRQEPDLTLEEIQRRLLDERQQKAGIGSV